MGVGSRAIDRHIESTASEQRWNQIRSLESLLTTLLVEASEAHHVAVEKGEDTDESWAPWYGHYIAHKLGPLLTSIQSVPVCERKVDTALEIPVEVHKRAGWLNPFNDTEEVTSVSKLHVG